MKENCVHSSVLLQASVDALVWKEGGVYVDGTFGAGGHSREILSRLSAGGKLYGLDRDARVGEFGVDDDRFDMIYMNYRHLAKAMRYLGEDKLSGVLLDLGVSSMQLDRSEYGMAYRFDAPLDMRMNGRQGVSALDVVNGYEERDLARVFREFGELVNARSLARSIVAARSLKAIASTGELVAVVEGLLKSDRLRGLSQVFQAIRMEVNEELASLSELLMSIEGLLEEGGRLVVITFHSLEDRIVKRFMKSGDVTGELQVNEYGQKMSKMKMMTSKPIIADEEERSQNKRSRSAKLRVAQKL